MSMGLITNLTWEEFIMVQKFALYGSDVSAGTYKCADCGYMYSNQSKKSLPPCPEHKIKSHSKNGGILCQDRVIPLKILIQIKINMC
jgi:DNA-directed RNA polymerase subunit RPC12/RpoP